MSISHDDVQAESQRGWADIPIRVEKTRSGDMMPSSEMMANGYHPDASSSHQENSSSDDVASSHSGSSDAPFPSAPKSEGRVHHIPIRIEGREERSSPVSNHHHHPPPHDVNSDGYCPDRSTGREASMDSGSFRSRSSSSGGSSNGHSGSSSGGFRSTPVFNQRSTPTPTSGSPIPESPVGSPKTVRQIPIAVEKTTGGGIRRVPPGPSMSRQPKAQLTPQEATGPSGPFVTKIAVTKSGSVAGDELPCGESPSPQPPVSRKKTPTEEISDINSELDKLKADVQVFSGEKKDKQYRFLDEMLTRLLIRLDNVEVNGDPEIRAARKKAINDVHMTVSLLESRAAASGTPTADVEMSDPQPEETSTQEEPKDSERTSGGTPDTSEDGPKSPAGVVLTEDQTTGPSEQQEQMEQEAPLEPSSEPPPSESTDHV